MQTAQRPDPVAPSLFSLPEQDGYEALDGALHERSGTVAVTAPPYAGRGAVLEHLADRLGTEAVRLPPDRTTQPAVPERTGEVLVVDGCQHLYDRCVGGFDALETFLDRVTRTAALVVTGWNAAAWAYLEAARGSALPAAFDTQFAVPGLDREAVETYVLDRHEGAVTFTAESADEVRPVRVEARTVTVVGRDLSIPVLRYDPDYRSARRAERFDDPADAAFARLTDVSDGNPGVAWAIWDASIDDGTVTVGEVAPPVDPVGSEVDADGAFTLQTVRCAGQTTCERLRAVVGEGTDRQVRALSRAGYLTVDDGAVAVPPAALPRVAVFCERRRMP